MKRSILALTLITSSAPALAEIDYSGMRLGFASDTGDSQQINIGYDFNRLISLDANLITTKGRYYNWQSTGGTNKNSKSRTETQTLGISFGWAWQTPAGQIRVYQQIGYASHEHTAKGGRSADAFRSSTSPYSETGIRFVFNNGLYTGLHYQMMDHDVVGYNLTDTVNGAMDSVKLSIGYRF